MVDRKESGSGEGHSNDGPPLFASWGHLYAAILALEALVVAAIAAFSAWRW